MSQDPLVRLSVKGKGYLNRISTKLHNQVRHDRDLLSEHTTYLKSSRSEDRLRISPLQRGGIGAGDRPVRIRPLSSAPQGESFLKIPADFI